MAKKNTQSGKTSSKSKAEISRAKHGIPAGLGEKKTQAKAEDYIEAIEVMAEATDFALSKALRREWRQHLYGYRGVVNSDKKIVLSQRNLENITQNAVHFLPDFIKSRAAHVEGEDLEYIKYSDVYSRTMEIFNAYSDEGLRDRVSKRLPVALGAFCDIPEPD